jgi:hypothetical protein
LRPTISLHNIACKELQNRVKDPISLVCPLWVSFSGYVLLQLKTAGGFLISRLSDTSG